MISISLSATDWNLIVNALHVAEVQYQIDAQVAHRDQFPRLVEQFIAQANDANRLAAHIDESL